MDMIAVIVLTLQLSTGPTGEPDRRMWSVDVLYRYVTYPTMDKCLSMLDGEIDRIEAVLTTVAPQMRADHTVNNGVLDNLTGRCVMVRKQDLQ
ncbi:hypothetical protein [Microvirga aerophila]|nr:hypothetical protein [Microvirga aerophila]